MKLNEIARVVGNILQTPIEPTQINLKSFEYKRTLNTKIWDKTTGKLNQKIRKRLLKIAKSFIDSTDIDFMPIDIVLVGSISSFNWSKYSDIDLHIIADYSTINPNKELVQNYMYSKKCEWNETHNKLNIYGYDVELYVQDIKDENTSNGIYSIKYDHWLKIPKYEHNDIDQNTVKQVSAIYINKIEYYNRKFNELTTDRSLLLLLSKVNYLYDLIIKGRKTALETDGEQASGNIIFKVLRRSGHLKALHDLKNKLYDRINSITETYTVEDDMLITESVSLINEYAYEDGRNTPEFIWKFPTFIWGDIKLGYSNADRADWWLQFDGIRDTEHDKKTLTVYGTEDGVYEALDMIFQHADETEVKSYYEELNLPGWEEGCQSIDLIETCIDYFKIK